MSYNNNSQIFESQIVIRDSSTVVSSTSGGLLVEGGISAKDTYISGHVAVNDVKITPNLNDILYEQEVNLTDTSDTWTDITGFEFLNELCNGFKATISVNLDSNTKYSLWEINGVLLNDNTAEVKTNTWTYNASFTGDNIEDLDFRVVDRTEDNIKFGIVQYRNTNSGTLIIRYRATTSGSGGHSPTLSENIFTEDRISDPFTQNSLFYAQAKDSVGYASGITYSNNILNVSSLSGGNVQVSTISTGALIVGGIRIDTNGGGASSWNLDNSNLSYTAGSVIVNRFSAGSVEVSAISTGSLFVGGIRIDTNGGLSSQWVDGESSSISYTSGNVSVDNFSAGSLGTGVVSAGTLHAPTINGSTINASSLTAGSIGVAIASAGTLYVTTITSGNLSSGVVSSGNIYGTGDILLSGANRTLGTTSNNNLSLRTSNLDRLIIASSGNIGIGTTSPNQSLTVNGNINMIGNRYLGRDLGTVDSTGIQFSVPNKIDFLIKDTKRMILNTAGNLGINITEPRSVLHIQQKESITGVQAPLAGHDLFNYDQAGLTIEYNIGNRWSISSSNYNDLLFSFNLGTKGYITDETNVGTIDFTGQHRCASTVITDVSNKIGYIVRSTGEYNNFDNSNQPSINESLPLVELTSSSNDKSVFGVISDMEDPNTRQYKTGNFVSVYKKDQTDDRLIINSLGEGGIWVCNANGNIQNGDYIASSIVPGIGMKQNSEFLANYTVAKATCDVDFSDSELENKLSLRYFLLDGSVITKMEYNNRLSNNEQVYIGAFIGCTYHCG